MVADGCHFCEEMPSGKCMTTLTIFWLPISISWKHPKIVAITGGEGVSAGSGVPPWRGYRSWLVVLSGLYGVKKCGNTMSCVRPTSWDLSHWPIGVYICALSNNFSGRGLEIRGFAFMVVISQAVKAQTVECPPMDRSTPPTHSSVRGDAVFLKTLVWGPGDKHQNSAPWIPPWPKQVKLSAEDQMWMPHDSLWNACPSFLIGHGFSSTQVADPHFSELVYQDCEDWIDACPVWNQSKLQQPESGCAGQLLQWFHQELQGNWLRESRYKKKSSRHSIIVAARLITKNILTQDILCSYSLTKNTRKHFTWNIPLHIFFAPVATGLKR